VHRALAAAVPRWGGVRMERSDPMALVSAGEEPANASAGPAGRARIDASKYDVAAPAPAWNVPSPPEDAPSLPQAPQTGARLEAGGASPFSASGGSSQAQFAKPGDAPRTDVAANVPARPGLLARVADAAKRLLGRRSGAASSIPQLTRRSSGPAGAPPRTQDAGTPDSPPSASGAKPVGLTSPAGVPAVGREVVVGSGGKDGKGGGGGGGAITLRGGAPKPSHRCAQPGEAKTSLLCFAARCMLADIRAAYEPLLAVTMAHHGAAPPGAPSGSGADLLGGMIAKGMEDAGQFVTRADALRAEVSSYDFRCADPRACDGLSVCRDFVVEQLRRAAASMGDSGRAFEAAREPCRALPVRDLDAGVRCNTALEQAGGADRDAFERIRQALLTAGGQSERQCRTPDAAEQRRWDTFNNSLLAGLRPILASVERPFCPDRLPCEPKGLGMIREAAGKLRDAGRAAESLGDEVPGLPRSGSDFTAAARELESAVPLIDLQDDRSRTSLFRGVHRVDRAAAQTAGAAETWNNAARGACSAN
ncbi:MAG: hypothetical protein HY553_07400, partial [Elusimicrobia bacterium]|nr:hypothetical protein [Elusimicrobiota bacterium]